MEPRGAAWLPNKRRLSLAGGFDRFDVHGMSNAFGAKVEKRASTGLYSYSCFGKLGEGWSSVIFPWTTIEIRVS